ncbi:MAG: NAD-dependent epimerase/dehydratase family protein [Nocardioides sp.]|nr:NAD-dependent epimerase/dehydratase family protein [Nocardioides sp.]
MGRVVLVTGVAREFASRFARALIAEPDVDRVVGVDVQPPRGDMSGVQFVRADIRNPVIAKVIAKEQVDTVVHMSVVATSAGAGGRGSVKELNVIGTMQLLAACQRAPSVEHLVVKSSTTVYGASSRDPAMFTEEMAPKKLPRSGFAKDAYEVEGYVRGFARRREDVTVTMLRAANTIGPRVDSPMAQYFRLPMIPTVLGFDARMQFLHETDMLAVLRHATLARVHGTFNVAGEGVLMLSQAVRRLGRPALPMPGFTLGTVGSLMRQAGLPGLAAEQLDFLTFGRGVDTRRSREVLGFSPAYSTAAAFEDFCRSQTRGLVAPSRIVVDGLTATAGRGASPAPIATPSGDSRG